MMTILDLLKSSDEYIKTEQFELAIENLENFLREDDNLAVWRKLAHSYIRNGQIIPARAVLRNIIFFIKNPMEWEVAFCRRPLLRCFLVPKFKIAYVNIPKCSSSTIKDALNYILNFKLAGELSHGAVSIFQQTIKADIFLKDYKEWTKILLVRDPIERLRSYYSKNICESKSLKQDVGCALSYAGLSTEPSYLDVLKKFTSYRRYFFDFLHHTNPISALAGSDPTLFNVIEKYSNAGNVVNLLSDISKINIPHIHNMRSIKTFNLTDEEKCIENEIKSFYSTDYKYYGDYFK